MLGDLTRYIALGDSVSIDLYPALDAGEVDVAPTDFRPDPGHLPVLDADEAARVAKDGRLVDVRAPERFRGEHEPIDPVAGHIPGATNIPFAENLVDGPHGTDRFREPDDAALRYAGSGVARGREVGVYCGSGVTATHTVFALHRFGLTAALYPGSWSEWVADPARPVATGP